MKTALRAFFCLWVGIINIQMARAQTPPPFAPPNYINNFAMAFTSAPLDLTRDGSPEFFSPGFIFIHMVVSMDENGGFLQSGNYRFLNGPSNPPGNLPMPTNTTSGDLTGDGRDDLVLATSTGSVHLLPNNGIHKIGQFSFLADTMIDNFGASYTINPPFVTFKTTYLKVIDIDGDGLNDVVMGTAPIDLWSAGTFPGEMSFYKNLGNNTFQKYSLPTPGNLIDAQWADVDGDGHPDHLVFVTETGAASAYGTDLHHAAWVNGQWIYTVASQPVGLGKISSFAMTNVSGSSSPDYLFATMNVGFPMSGVIYALEGDGLGNMNQSAWSVLPVPVSSQPFSDHILSMKVSDFDKDGYPDIIVHRGYANPPSTNSGNPTFGTDELIYIPGSQFGFAVASTIPLTGYSDNGWTGSRAFSILPMVSQPDLIQLVDFGGDRAMDLFIGSMTAGTIHSIVTVKNTTGWRLGDPAFEKVGSPSGGDPLHPARLGFDGGTPLVGNSNFAATISGLSSGSLVGLTWGSFATPALFNTYGIDINVVPEVFGNLAWTSGSAVDDGFYSYPLPIPNNPSLVGDTGNFQYNYYNPGTGRFGGTQGTHLVIGH